MLNQHLIRQKLQPPIPKLFSGALPLTPPTLSLLSPVDADTPWFDMDVPASISVGDSIEMQYATVADFSTNTSIVTTLTNAQCGHCTLDLAQTALTNSSTYYFRSRWTIRGTTGPWSATNSYTVATASLPKVRNVGAGKYPSTSFDGTMIIGKDMDFGPPDSTRFIIACIGGEFSTFTPTDAPAAQAWVITDKNIAAGTFQGTALSLTLNNTLTSNQGAIMFTGIVANGRSGRIAFNVGYGGLNGIGVASAYNLTSLTPSDTKTAIRTFPADPFPIGTAITIPTGGFALAFAEGESAGYSVLAWQNGFTKMNAADIKSNGSAFSSMGVNSTPGSAIAAVNRSNFQDTSGIAAAWS